MKIVNWTEERIEHLIILQAAGRSATEIAQEMGGGVTRNGVLGKCFRLKLRAVNGPIGSKPKRQYPPRKPRLRNRYVALSPRQIEFRSRETEPFPGIIGITLSEIGPMQCRWIEGDNALFCGNETDGGSWCPHHRAICFTTAQPRANPAVAFANRKRAGKALALAGVCL